MRIFYVACRKSLAGWMPFIFTSFAIVQRGADFFIDVSIVDPTGSQSAYYSSLTSHTIEAGKRWGSHFNGNTSLQVEIEMNSSIPRANGASVTRFGSDSRFDEWGRLLPRCSLRHFPTRPVDHVRHRDVCHRDPRTVGIFLNQLHRHDLSSSSHDSPSRDLTDVAQLAIPHRGSLGFRQIPRSCTADRWVFS